jgi:Protein of unknown function (DUF3300)
MRTSTPQQTVATTTNNRQNYITIEPASPQVVYVPQYNPVAVWGSPVYRYPAMYYPPGLGLMTRAFTGCPVFEVLAVGDPQTGRRSGRKRIARSHRGPGNRVPQGYPPIRQQGRKLAHPGTGALPARSPSTPSKENATVRFWRCFSAVLCAGANSRRPGADMGLKSYVRSLSKPPCGRLVMDETTKGKITSIYLYAHDTFGGNRPPQ